MGSSWRLSFVRWPVFTHCNFKAVVQHFGKMLYHYLTNTFEAEGLNNYCNYEIIILYLTTSYLYPNVR